MSRLLTYGILNGSFVPPPPTVIEISAGNLYSLGINSKSVTWAWGVNNFGQLGDNSVTCRCTPVSVLGAVKTFCKISTGQDHTMAIDKNGRAWGWGSNSNGKLGNNSTLSRRTPVSVLGAVKTFCQISAGGGHTMAIDKNGRAWGWGTAQFGQLGNNSTTSRLTPVSVLGAVKTFCQISAGPNHTMAIDKNGRAWGWGNNTGGKLGDNSTTSRLTPVSVLGAVKTFCQISAGVYLGTSLSHTAAIDKNGRAWCWGDNQLGQLGDNSTTSRRTPVSVAGAVKTFCKISANRNYTMAIDKNGRAWGWGYNLFGQLGDNSTTSRRTPVSVLGAIKTFCQISAGSDHTMAIDKNGRAWAWGSNRYGQLGSGIVTYTPMSVAGAVKTFCQINAGQSNAMAIDKDGRAWGWGFNGSGQLGDNSSTNRSTPVSVLGAVKTFCQISASDNHTIAIDKNGRAWGWGNNTHGQLGDNSTTIRLTPVSVLGAVKTFCRISTGTSYTLAIDKNGRAWGWGVNNFGQLGDNSTTSRRTPVSVAGAVKTFCRISTNNIHTAAIDKNGRAWGWGNNNDGRLGDNSITSRLTPVSVLGAVKTFCQISAGQSYTMAIDKNGRAWGWGNNSFGQLGDNSLTSRRTPVSVAGVVKTFCQISAGLIHTMAIDKNGRAWGWGYNTNGELGSDIDTVYTPVSVLGAVKTFCQISAGSQHTIAIDKNGRAWGWGLNSSGQLGTNYFTWTPILITYL